MKNLNKISQISFIVVLIIMIIAIIERGGMCEGVEKSILIIKLDRALKQWDQQDEFFKEVSFGE